MDSFDWDPDKDVINQLKHEVSFNEAQFAFFDQDRVIAEDMTHSSSHDHRYYCFGRTQRGILTVRFIIPLIGAGYWPRGKRVYEQENQVQQ